MTRVTISDVAMAAGVSSPLATKPIVRASTSSPRSAGREEVIGKNE